MPVNATRTPLPTPAARPFSPNAEAKAGQVQRVSAESMAQRAEALAWRGGVSAPVAMVWLPDGWATEPSQAVLWGHLLSERARRSLRTALNSSHPGRSRRASYMVSERFALRAAMEEVLGVRCWVLGEDPTPNTQHLTPNTLYLVHTPLGQPQVRWRGAAAAWAREQGLTARHLHISFSHDGDAHLCLAAYAPGLCGLGVDVVHLPRLRRDGKDGDHLRRFARRFMSGAEYAAFEAASARDDPETFLRRTAAHFSLMEAASKALGTGLKIGGGMGRPTSLPMNSLNIASLDSAVGFLLGPEARARCAALGAKNLEGHWGADMEYLVSAVLLWE